MDELIEKFVKKILFRESLTEMIVELTEQNIGIVIQPSPVYSDLIEVRLIDIRTDEKLTKAVRLDKMAIQDIRH